MTALVRSVYSRAGLAPGVRALGQLRRQGGMNWERIVARREAARWRKGRARSH